MKRNWLKRMQAYAISLGLVWGTCVLANLPRPLFAAPSDQLGLSLTLETPPAGVSDLVATQGSSDGVIDLTWTEPGDDGYSGTAVFYQFRVSSTTNMEDDADFTDPTLGKPLDTFSGTPVPVPGPGGSLRVETITGLTPGVTYYFAIRAVDDDPPSGSTGTWLRNVGLNRNSTNYVVAPDSPPAAPTGLSALHGPTYVRLQWNANAEADIAFYRIYRDAIDPADTFIAYTTTSATGFVDSGLDPANTYFYRISAVDTGPSVLESPLTQWTTGHADAAPRLSEVARSSITAAWYGDSPDGGFTLEASTAADFTGPLFSSATVAAAPAGLALASLGLNTTYYLRLAALWGAATTYVAAVPASTATLANAPAVPAMPFSDVQLSSITAQWTANGNPPGTLYELEASSTAFDGSGSLLQSGRTPNVFANTAGLLANTTYTLRARAFNWNGMPSSFTLLGATATLADQPVGVSISAAWNSSMTVTWAAGAADGYLLQVSSTGFTGAGTIYSSVTYNGAATALTATGILANTTFYVRVGALNLNSAAHFAAGGASSTLANLVANAQIFGAWTSSVTLNWNPHLALPQDLSAEGYRVDASSAADFSGTLYVSSQAGVSPSTLTITGLLGSTTYYFRVGSLNWPDRAHYATIGSTRTAASSPLNPLVAQVFGSSIAVTWGAVFPDGGYVLDASTSSDFTTRLTSTTSSGLTTGLAVAGLDFNTTYYLRAGALWGATTFYAFTAPSATATLANEPGAGAGLVDIFVSSISAVWTANANPSGTVFRLEASSTNFQAGTLVVTSTTLNLQDFNTALLANTTYTLRVKAVNHNGLSSGYLALGTTSTLAGLPTGINITAVYKDSMTVAWTGGLAQGYALEASSTNFAAGTYYSSVTFNGAVTELTLTGILANTTFYVRVGALNHSGAPHFAAGGSSSTLAELAAGSQIFSVDITSVTLNWSPRPGAPQDLSAEGYLLEASTASDFSGPLYASATANIALSTLTLYGLDATTTYYFRLATLNWPSIPHYVTVGSTYTRSQPPVNPAIFAAHRTSMTITWGQVGSAGYIVEASTATDFTGAADVSSITANGLTTSLQITGLALNTTYFLRAGAFWGAATSYALTTPVSTPTRVNEPGLAGASFTNVYLSSISAVWTNNLNPLGTRYQLEASSTAFDGSGTVVQTPSTLDIFSSIQGLLAGTTYTLRVRAFNWISLPSSFTLLGATSTLSAPPALVNITAVWNTSMTVAWAAGTPQGYDLHASTAPDFSGTVYSSRTFAGSTTELTLTGLLANTTFYVRAGALNYNAVPHFTYDGSSATLANTVIGAQIYNILATSVTVNWIPLPAAPPSASAEGYLLEASTASDFSGLLASSSTFGVLPSTLTIGNLNGGTTYYFRLASINWASRGHYVFVGSTFTSAPPPGSPLVAQVNLSSITITWTGVNPSDGYLIDASTSSDFTTRITSATANTSATQLTVIGLSLNTTYYLRAGAVWAGATSYAFTTPGSTATLTSVPTAAPPAFLTVGLSSVSLQWANGAPPNPAATLYRLEASSTNFLAGTLIVTSNTLNLQDLNSGLLANTTYAFRVKSVNHNSVESGALVLGSTSTLATPPTAPSITAVWQSSLSVVWSASVSQGYVLEGSSTNFAGGGTVYRSSTALGGATTLDLTALLANTTFYVRVGALNHNTVPNFATAGASITLALALSNAQIAIVDGANVTVNWTPLAAAPQDLSAQGYLLETSTTSDFSTTIVSSTSYGVQPSTLTIADLEVFTTYYFRLASLNWEFAPHYVLVGSTLTNSDTPINPVISAVFEGSVTVNWISNSPNEGYLLQASTDSLFAGTLFSSRALNSFTTSLNVPGLAPNTTYYLRAGAVISGTTKYAFTAPASTATLAVRPSTQTPTFTAVFTSSAALQWTTGGNPAGTTYVVEASSTGFLAGTALPAQTVIGVNDFMTSLAANTTYTFRVHAVNHNALETADRALGSTTTLAVAPTGVAIEEIWFSSMVVHWSSGPSRGYLVEASSTNFDGSGALLLSSTTVATTSSTVITGLVRNTTYFLRVGALNHQSLAAYSLGDASSTLTDAVTGVGLSGVHVASITISWNTLPGFPQIATSEGYRLEASTDINFSGQIFSTVTPLVSVATLTINNMPGDATYYFRLGALNWQSRANYTVGPSTYLPFNKPAPYAPYGLGIAKGVAVATITWMPVEKYADLEPFDDLNDVSPNEVQGYRLYRATLPTSGAWSLVTQVASTFNLVAVDNAASQLYYYTVRAYNPRGESLNSIVRAWGTESAWLVAPDGLTSIEVPVEVVSPLDGTGKVKSQVYEIRITSHPEDLGGRVFKSIEFSAHAGGETYTSDFELPGLAVVKIYYETGAGGGVVPSGTGLSAAPAMMTTSPGNMSVYWYDGSTWQQMFGAPDTVSQLFTIETKYLGKFQLRAVERLSGFAFDTAGVSNRLITPNGDGLNDFVVFTFANPRDSQVSGVIFDLKGARVADMMPGPVANSLMWDGKMNGTAVRGGVYIYQIKAENQVHNGTVVIIK